MSIAGVVTSYLCPVSSGSRFFAGMNQRHRISLLLPVWGQSFIEMLDMGLTSALTQESSLEFLNKHQVCLVIVTDEEDVPILRQTRLCQLMVEKGVDVRFVKRQEKSSGKRDKHQDLLHALQTAATAVACDYTYPLTSDQVFSPTFLEDSLNALVESDAEVLLRWSPELILREDCSHTIPICEANPRLPAFNWSQLQTVENWHQPFVSFTWSSVFTGSLPNSSSLRLLIGSFPAIGALHFHPAVMRGYSWTGVHDSDTALDAGPFLERFSDKIARVWTATEPAVGSLSSAPLAVTDVSLAKWLISRMRITETYAWDNFLFSLRHSIDSSISGNGLNRPRLYIALLWYGLIARATAPMRRALRIAVNAFR